MSGLKQISRGSPPISAFCLSCIKVDVRTNKTPPKADVISRLSDSDIRGSIIRGGEGVLAGCIGFGCEVSVRGARQKGRRDGGRRRRHTSAGTQAVRA